jgi:hypothetical protein
MILSFTLRKHERLRHAQVLKFSMLTNHQVAFPDGSENAHWPVLIRLGFDGSCASSRNAASVIIEPHQGFSDSGVEQ